MNNSAGAFNVTDCIFTGGIKAINASGGAKMTLNITNSNFLILSI